jgi:hypothetical protein
MKINLIKSDDDKLSGYTNVNVAQTGLDLKDICAAECSEIRAHNIINAVPPPQAEPLLNHILSKLAHKGIFNLAAPEASVVAYSYARGDLTLAQFNQLIHSGQSSFTADSLCEFFQAKGFKVLNKRIHEFHVYLTVERQ